LIAYSERNVVRSLKTKLSGQLWCVYLTAIETTQRYTIFSFFYYDSLAVGSSMAFQLFAEKWRVFSCVMSTLQMTATKQHDDDGC